MDKDKLYEEYIQDNKDTFVTFTQIYVSRSNIVTLVFEGEDVEGNAIEIEQELEADYHIFKDRTLYCSEEKTFKELGLTCDGIYAEIKIKPAGSRKFIDLYDWL